MKEYTAGISITEACNQTCEHCYIGRKMYWHEKNYKFKSIPKDKFNLLVVQLVEANVTRVNFGGGESPLHPHFLTFAQKLYDAGIKTSLVTNGSNISMNKIRPNLSLFNDVGVSIDFSDERHSINRRKPDSFKSAVRSLKEIVESKKTKTEMVTCIMNINYSNLPQLYELAKSIGVDMWRLNRFHPTKNDLSRFSINPTGLDKIIDISYLACSPQQMREAFEFLSSITPKEQNYIISDPVFRTLVNGNGIIEGVPYGKISFRIKSDGGVVPNLFTDNAIGNVFETPLKSILESEEYNHYSRKLEGKCTKCINNNSCKGGDITDTILTDSKSDPYCFLETDLKSDTKIIPLSETNFVHESYLSTIYVPIKWGTKK